MFKIVPGEDVEKTRRRMIRYGHALHAQMQADAPGSLRREALEAADRSEALGLVADAAVHRQIAEDLIPEHLRWAFCYLEENTV